MGRINRERGRSRHGKAGCWCVSRCSGASGKNSRMGCAAGLHVRPVELTFICSRHVRGVKCGHLRKHLDIRGKEIPKYQQVRIHACKTYTQECFRQSYWNYLVFFKQLIMKLIIHHSLASVNPTQFIAGHHAHLHSGPLYLDHLNFSPMQFLNQPII